MTTAILFLTPLSLQPIANSLRALFGVVAFARLRRPVDTPRYRREFIAWIVLVPLTALLGLSSWIKHPDLSNWVSFGSLAQAIFNLVMVGVLCLRRHVHGPRWSTPAT
jgi:hypothetical protein